MVDEIDPSDFLSPEELAALVRYSLAVVFVSLNCDPHTMWLL